MAISNEKVRYLFAVRILRNIVVYLLALNIIGSSLMVPLIYLDFELRRDYIAEVLCINRDEPITVCGGKCYLDLKLDQATERQDQEHKTSNRPVELSFFNEEVTALRFNFIPVPASLTLYKQESPGVTRSFIGDIFRPPQSA